MLQTARPDQPIVPVLVCRKAHKTTFWMAQQLGFLTIDMGIQYAGDIKEDELLEVRNELHFRDLAPGQGPSVRAQDRLTNTLPRTSPTFAQQWAATASDALMTELIRKLRYSSRQEHDALLADLRQANIDMGRRGGW